jgi:predicted DNA-binding transcriptional regulator AlpA
MSPKRTVGDRFKGSAAPPDYHANPPEALLLEQQQDARGPPDVLPFERPWGRPTLAEYMGLTVSGLDKLIKDRRAPPYFKAGRMLRWRPSVVRAWTLAQEEQAAATDAATVDPR